MSVLKAEYQTIIYASSLTKTYWTKSSGRESAHTSVMVTAAAQNSSAPSLPPLKLSYRNEEVEELVQLSNQL